MEGFKEFRVWQQGIEQVAAGDRATGRFPAGEANGLVSQIRRAAVSVPSNIADGHAREHLEEHRKHLSVARGSLADVETQTGVAWQLAGLRDGTAKSLTERTASLARQLRAQRNALKGGGNAINT